MTIYIVQKHVSMRHGNDIEVSEYPIIAFKKEEDARVWAEEAEENDVSCREIVQISDDEVLPISSYMVYKSVLA